MGVERLRAAGLLFARLLRRITAERRIILLLIFLGIAAAVALYAVRRFAPALRERPLQPSSSPLDQDIARPQSRAHPPEWTDEFILGDRYAIPPERPSSPPVPWTTRQVFLALAATAAVFLTVVGSVVFLVQMTELGDWGGQVVLLGVTLVLQGVMLLSVWHFAVRPVGGKWATLGFRRIAPISTTLIVIGGITAAQMVVIGYTQVVSWLGVEALIPGDQFGSWDIDPLSFAVIAFSAIVIAPLFEEIFFRGFMYQAFRKSMPLWLAAVLSSAIFGIVHIDAAIIIPIAFVGMILLGIYRWTGNLWSSIITHAGYNTVAVVALAVQTWGA